MYDFEFHRWLTLAARLLRLYTSTKSPTNELVQIIVYLMGHYIPMWFQIRSSNSCSNGTKNLWRSVELLQQLPTHLQSLIQSVIQRNGYWAHPEAVLLTMLSDEDSETRSRAVQTIHQCRQEVQQQQQSEARPFVLPKINFEATDYTELLDWTSEFITEPPLTMSLSEAELESICAAPLQVNDFPVHTVAVERTVKVVTEASRVIVGDQQRHGWIGTSLLLFSLTEC